jgi:DNA invertase Pin-like site-specific DNA recombinase
MPELVGYARVSTRDQTPALQLDALRAAGCRRVFDETASGACKRQPSRKADSLIGGRALSSA